MWLNPPAVSMHLVFCCLCHKITRLQVTSAAVFTSVCLLPVTYSKPYADTCVRVCARAGDCVPANASLPPASGLAVRSSHNLSRTRMCELFTRAAGSSSGSPENILFNGLRVRMVSVRQCRFGCTSIGINGFWIADVRVHFICVMPHLKQVVTHNWISCLLRRTALALLSKVKFSGPSRAATQQSLGLWVEG